MEDWRLIPSLGGKYSASGDGFIRDNDPSHVRGLNRRGGVLAGAIGSAGYLLVGVFRPDGSRMHALVHRLVAEAFHGQTSPGQIANHINGIRSDARAANLEWISQSENILHSTRVLGKNRGGCHAMAILDEARVLEIRARWAAGEKRPSLAAAYGVSVDAVNAVVYRKQWKHV